MAEVFGTENNDVLIGTNEQDNIVGGEGNDIIDGNGGDDELYGGHGDDVLRGSARNNVLFGGTGENIYNSGIGNDTIVLDYELDGAERGSDIIVFSQGHGHDEVYGFDVNSDRIDLSNFGFNSFSEVQNFIYEPSEPGGSLYIVFDQPGVPVEETDVIELKSFDSRPLTADNFIFGDGESEEPEDLIINGSDESEELFGDLGNDIIDGNGGDDELYGEYGDDVLRGGAGNDVLFGGNGDDVLRGGAGNDVLFGGMGENIYDGGIGNDTIVLDHELDGGEKGSNIIVFSQGDGHDEVYGFDEYNDRIDLSNFGFNSFSEVQYFIYEPSEPGGSLYIAFDQPGVPVEEPDVIELKSFSGPTLTADNFIFGDGESEEPEDLIITGSDESEKLSGGLGNDIIDGNGGDDELYGAYGDDVLRGGAGNDVLFGGAGENIYNGGIGNDTIVLDYELGSIDYEPDDAERGSDIIVFSRGDGHDEVHGFDANSDRIDLSNFGFNSFSEVQNFIYESGPGGSLYIAFDQHIAFGQHTVIVEGKDVIELKSFSGPTLTADNFIFAEPEGEIITGTKGQDSLMGTDYDDTISGLKGMDTIFGGDGADLINGGNGRDVLHGGTGDDKIFAGRGHDTLYGDNGNDELHFGRGKDIATGGDGDDLFVFSNGNRRDVITDFSDGDTIQLNIQSIDDFDDVMANAKQISEGVMLKFGTDKLVLQGIEIDDLNESDFIFG